MTKKEKLIEQRNKLQVQINDIEHKELVEVSLPKLRKSVGKCFKFRNSYGGSMPSWWLYMKITGINEETMTFTTVEFQKTSMNEIEVKFSQKYNFNGRNYMSDSNYIPITKGEYNKARKSFEKTFTRLISA